MAYPTSLDNIATGKTDSTVTATDHPTHHNDLATAVNAIEAELGLDPSGASTTVAARLGLMPQPGTVDSAPAAALITPSTTNDENGFAVKAPDATWGDGTYGTGDAFILFREDYAGGSEVEPDRNILFRVDGFTGAIGTSGGIHVATGFRKHTTGTQPLYGIHVDPTDDLPGILVDRASTTSTADLIQFREAAGTVNARITNVGALVTNVDISARDNGTSKVLVGNIFGSAGVLFGNDSTTFFVREAAGVFGIYDALQFREVAAPSTPPADRLRLFSRDSGGGKTQLCAIFPSGNIVVIAEDF